MDSLDMFSGSYNQRLLDTAREKKVPISGTFELLPTCNMRCRMCYIQHTPKKEELQTVEFWNDIFDQAIAEGLLMPLITGGEPFLYPDFERLYDCVIRKPILLCINTNATLLNREKVKWLAKNPPKRLNISLYGASDETYTKLCGNPNGFSQVMHAFDLLKEYGIPYEVHSVMVPENVADYRKIIEICNERKVKLGMTNYMFPSYRKDGCGVEHDARFTPYELAHQSLVYLRDHFKDQNLEYLKHVTQRCMAMDHPEIYSLYGNNQVVCKGGVCSFWIDWRGNLSGCGIHNQGRISLHEMPFAEAWKQVVRFTDNIRIAEKCKDCRYRCICYSCPAAGFCETGKMDGVPEYLCEYCSEYEKLLNEERVRLLETIK